MTPEQQRIAIAKACGYQKGWNYKSGYPADFTQEWHIDSLPDYLNDLNAMHDAEKNFSASSEQMRYAFNLLNVMKLQVKYEDDDLNVDYCWHACRATAAQRAEAFLRTLNLWKDT
jgi:hypothetical protein